MRATTGPAVPLKELMAAGAARTSTRPTTCGTTAGGWMTAIGAVATGGTRGGLWESRGSTTGAIGETATTGTAQGATATDLGGTATGTASAERGLVRASEAAGTKCVI